MGSKHAGYSHCQHATQIGPLHEANHNSNHIVCLMVLASPEFNHMCNRLSLFVKIMVCSRVTINKAILWQLLATIILTRQSQAYFHPLITQYTDQSNGPSRLLLSVSIPSSSRYMAYLRWQSGIFCCAAGAWHSWKACANAPDSRAYSRAGSSSPSLMSSLVPSSGSMLDAQANAT